MRLFKEVPITSAEQARSLPDEAILIDQDYGILYERSGDDWSDPEGFSIDATGNSALALVPIEAEEEAGYVGGKHTHTRYKTPWEAE